MCLRVWPQGLIRKYIQLYRGIMWLQWVSRLSRNTSLFFQAVARCIVPQHSSTFSIYKSTKVVSSYELLIMFGFFFFLKPGHWFKGDVSCSSTTHKLHQRLWTECNTSEAVHRTEWWKHSEGISAVTVVLLNASLVNWNKSQNRVIVYNFRGLN